jgi:glycosyltransferase involved in cell wall biosynthesis
VSNECNSLTLFLYNPISGQGHLDSYARLYTEACLRLGYRTVLVSAAEAGLSDYVERRLPAEHARHFQWVSFDEADRSQSENHRVKHPRKPLWSKVKPISVARALLRWITTLGLYLLRRGYRHIRPLIPGQGRQWIASLLQSMNPDNGRIPYGLVAARVCEASRLTGLTPSLVFILYLDLMSHRVSDIRAMDTSIGCGWAGILFHPSRVKDDAQPSERLFNSRRLQGLLFLNPYSVDLYHQSHPDLFFTRAPDVAITDCNVTSSQLAQTMVARAAGRKIVLMIGAISAFKGLMDFIALTHSADPGQFFFAIIGCVHWSTLGMDEQRIRDFYSSHPENVFTHDAYLENEDVYNSFISCSNVIYAVYKGAMGSSNTLTKAAFFGRPVLVAQDSYLGELVLGSGTGAVVEADNTHATCQALNDVLGHSIPQENYLAYYQLNSLPALQAALGKALHAWCKSGSAVLS